MNIRRDLAPQAMSDDELALALAHAATYQLDGVPPQKVWLYGIDVADWFNAASQRIAQLATLRAEVERLREVYDPTIEVSGKLAEQVTALQAEIERYDNEVERLREAINYTLDELKPLWELDEIYRTTVYARLVTALQGGRDAD